MKPFGGRRAPERNVSRTSKPLASNRRGALFCLPNMTTKTKPVTAKSKASGKVASKGGRPRKYASPDDFNAAVEAYLTKCRDDEVPITWTGLALGLGFSSRESIDEYLNYDGFSDSVKRAKLIVQNAYECRLSGNSPTGAIFALKNFGWHDKQEVQADVTHRTLAESLADLNGRAAKD